jgi:tetratricopeptide (TPR) repeat protein
MTNAKATPATLTRANAFARDAARHVDRGDFAAAENAATFALALAPNHSTALRVSGSVHRRRGRHDTAEEYLRAALFADPDDALARRELAGCLVDQGQLVRAIALLQTPSPSDAETWFKLGALHDMNADAPAALDAAQKVLRLAPQHTGAQFLVARALTSLGQIDEAAAQYRRLTRLPAQAAKAWFALLDFKTIRVTADELRSIEQLERNSRTIDQDRMLASYALGQAYEMAGRPDDAVRAFDAANRWRRRETVWDSQSYTKHIDAIRAAFPTHSGDIRCNRGAEVIFVLGMPRSGTTLVEQILAAHPHVVGASELPDMAQVIAAESQRRGSAFPTWAADVDDRDWQRLGEEYLARTKRWQTSLRFTDKMPENWLYVGAILRMLPGARVIGCERDPIETAWSCYKQLFAPGQLGWSYDVDSLAAYSCDSRRLWQHFARNEPQRCRTQHYESILSDLDSQVRQLLAFAGLEYHPACLDFSSARRETRSASAAQVRQPINRATARRNLYGHCLDHLIDALDRAEKANSS